MATPLKKTATYGDAYESQEDAENALRQIANDDYSHVKWDVSTEHHILRIYSNEGHSSGYDYDDDGIELKVEKFRLRSKGCDMRIELKRPRSLGDYEEDKNGEPEVVLGRASSEGGQHY